MRSFFVELCIGQKGAETPPHFRVFFLSALYVLYTYMISQRKKALGGGRKVGQQKKKI